MKNRKKQTNKMAPFIKHICHSLGCAAFLTLVLGLSLTSLPISNLSAAEASPGIVAQNDPNNPDNSTTITNNSCADDADPSTCEGLKTIDLILNLLAVITMPVILGVIIVGGIQYSASGGNPEANKAALKRIFTAVIALIAFVGLWSFLQWLIPGGII